MASPCGPRSHDVLSAKKISCVTLNRRYLEECLACIRRTIEVCFMSHTKDDTFSFSSMETILIRIIYLSLRLEKARTRGQK